MVGQGSGGSEKKRNLKWYYADQKKMGRWPYTNFKAFSEFSYMNHPIYTANSNNFNKSGILLCDSNEVIFQNGQ